ncbi:MAG: hypothetical protein R2862_03460 [Thermoanaerobaculia bacterium]
MTQAEFILMDETGGEIVVPRAALSRLEATENGHKALIKDGTSVEGELQGKFEIADGMIKRRFAPEDISSVEFDRYIVPAPGKQYRSCPIRVELDAGWLSAGGKEPMEEGLERRQLR